MSNHTLGTEEIYDEIPTAEVATYKWINIFDCEHWTMSILVQYFYIIALIIILFHVKHEAHLMSTNY